MTENEWVRPTCFLCGRELSDLELGLGLYSYIYPGCDYYDPGGFCTREGFGRCIFEDEVICESCAESEEGCVVVYVGDACMELWEDEDDEFYDGWKDPMDEAYRPKEESPCL